VKTVGEIAIITVLAWFIAEYQPWGPASLGNFYATMVIVSCCYALRTARIDFAYAGIFFFMVCGYAIDEMTDWLYPTVVMNVDILLGVILFQWCTSADSANKWLGAVLLTKALWGAVYLYGGMVSIGLYAMVLNFLSIIAWVWFADLSIARRRHLKQPEGDNQQFYLRTPWLPHKKL